MMQILETTDGKFVGHIFDENQPLVLDGTVFVPDQVSTIADGVKRLSNSNYVIETKEV